MTLVATNLTNFPIGGQWNTEIMFKWTAKTQAPLCAIRTCWIVKNPDPTKNYTEGTGGSVQWSLWTDSNGEPGNPICYGRDAVSEPVNNGDFPIQYFDYSGLLIPGAVYNVCVRSNDPAPQLDYDSINLLQDAATLDQTPDIQVWIRQEAGDWKQRHDILGAPVTLYFANGDYVSHPQYEVTAGGVLPVGTGYGFLGS